MTIPKIPDNCKFRTPPDGVEIVSLNHDPWIDWYWRDEKRNLLVYITTEKHEN